MTINTDEEEDQRSRSRKKEIKVHPGKHIRKGDDYDEGEEYVTEYRKGDYEEDSSEDIDDYDERQERIRKAQIKEKRRQERMRIQ